MSKYLWWQKEAPRDLPANDSEPKYFEEVGVPRDSHTSDLARGDRIYFLTRRGDVLWHDGSIRVDEVRSEGEGVLISEKDGKRSRVFFARVEPPVLERIVWLDEAGEARSFASPAPPPSLVLVPITDDAAAALDELAPPDRR